MFGEDMVYEEEPMMFGKRRRTAKVSKKAAMKAFRSFYKRHCAGARRSGFGNGGNPPLNQSMGYEFCPTGSGGVLGFNSTGLFPSPCTAKPKSSSMGLRRSRKPAKKTTKKRCYGTGSKRKSAIGARRRRRSSAVGSRRR
jgi:hypothetical protein